jgi:hypothetical protein
MDKKVVYGPVFDKIRVETQASNENSATSCSATIMLILVTNLAMVHLLIAKFPLSFDLISEKNEVKTRHINSSGNKVL